MKEANADKLWRNFNDLQFNPGECVEDFALRITANANQLHTLGDKAMEKEVIKKLLHYVHEHLPKVAISIETLLDLNSTSIEEVTRHLRAV
jgi:translation initiation factor 2 alpha subunit (eIF-2alpha)